MHKYGHPPPTNPADSTGIYLKEIFSMTGERHKNFYLSFAIIIGGKYEVLQSHHQGTAHAGHSKSILSDAREPLK